MDVNALREEHNQIMAKARALAAKAADREFTEQEQRVAVELQRQAADVERRLKQAEDDAEVKKAIADLGNAIGGASTAPVSVKAEPARPVHPRVRAAGGTAGGRPYLRRTPMMGSASSRCCPRDRWRSRCRCGRSRCAWVSRS